MISREVDQQLLGVLVDCFVDCFKFLNLVDKFVQIKHISSQLVHEIINEIVRLIQFAILFGDLDGVVLVEVELVKQAGNVLGHGHVVVLHHPKTYLWFLLAYHVFYYG